MRRTTVVTALLIAGAVGVAGCTSGSTTTESTSSAAATNAAATGPTSAAPSSSTAPAAEPAYVAKATESIRTTMQDNVIPGAVVLISSPDQGDWTGAFGTRTWGTDEPMQADDHFRIGSNTKTITSTVILQLAQEGKLALDDPIAKYIPNVPNGDQITIANLSEMRSGLYSYSFDTAFNNTLDQQPQKNWTPQELVDIGSSQPVAFAPGAQFDYSNTNIILLGMVIEKLTGMSASEAFQERVFAPLGLENTSLPLPADSSIPNPHPQGYSFGSNTETIQTYALPAADQPLALAGRLLPNNETMANPSWAWTAGGAISTVGDMKTYVEALVGGGLLDEQMQKTRMDSIQAINPAQPTSGYGLGIAKFDKLYGHDGQIPGYMTFMGHDPDSGLTIVIGTNLATVPNGEGSALAILKGLIPIFYPNAVIPGDPAAAPGATAAASAGGTSPSTSTGG